MASGENAVGVEGPVYGPSDLYERVLRALPEWFGDEEALADYFRTIPSLPTFLARRQGVALGFLTVKRHFEHAAELYCMGVLPEHHRGGVGRRLLIAAEEWLNGLGVKYLQVKTLSPSAAYEPYERTRRFYASMHFRPIEEFKTLWNSENPCLLMIKRLGPPSR